MKRRNNRFLAGTLAGLMMLTMLPVTALAAEEGAEGNVAVEAEGGYEQDNNEDNIYNVVNDFDTLEASEGEGVPVAGANGEGESNPVGGDGESESNPTGGENDSNKEESNPVGGENGDGEGENNSTGGETSDPVTPPAETFTAKIGDVKYDSLSEAVEAAKSGDVIEVGEDITLDSGLNFNNKGELTITASDDVTITLNEIGMALDCSNVTFQNITIVENAVNNPTGSGGTANLINDSALTLDNTKLHLNGPGNQTGGHGIYLYQKSDLYVTNGSEIVISDFNGSGASGIYADYSEWESGGKRSMEITGGSSIRITNCMWNGMTINPIDVTIDDYSKIDVSECGGNGGKGGIGCYYGTFTISDHSVLNVDDNEGGSWGIFVNGLSIDSTSSMSASRNASYGAVLAAKSTIAAGAKVTLSGNKRAGLRVYTGSNYWYGDVTIEDGADFLSTGNLNGIEIMAAGKLNMQGGTVEKNHSTTYGGGLYNSGGVAVIGGSAEIANNHADTAGDDIYNTTNTAKNGTVTEPSLTLAPTGDGWTLDDCGDPIVGWYQDGERQRWNGDATDDSYYADEYTVSADAVSDTLTLKAAHGLLCNVTYEVTGNIPSDAGSAPAAVKVKRGGSYTAAPAQTTTQTGYTFDGWRIDGTGDIVTSIDDIQSDVKLVGVWTYTAPSDGGSSGGGGNRRPSTVTIPDDVPTGLDGDDHFAYIVGYPDGNVKPSGSITRAEVATIFFRLLTEEVRTANSTQNNSLSDVTRGQWFNHAISTLSAMGIVKGKTDGSFDPDAPITRAEFAAIAARFDDKDTDTSSNFTDISSHWAKNEIGIAANKGWINGYPDNTFRPDQNITRAEAMTLVNRVLNRLPETAEDLLHEDMIKWPDNADKDAWFYLAVQEATNSHDYADKSAEDKFEKWTVIRDARDWTLLEK